MDIAIATEQKSWKNILFAKDDKKLSFAFIATLILPWALIFNRTIADVCCIVIGVLWLWQSYEQKNWSWLKDPLVILGFLAWGWLVVVVSPLAISPKESFGVAVPWIRYILLFAALRYWVLARAESLLLLGKVLAGMLVFVVIDTLWQYQFGMSLTGHMRDSSGRLSGPFDNVKVGIFLAKMLLPIIGIVLFATMSKKQNSLIIFAVLLIVIGEIVILLSGERTAFVSSIIGISSMLALLATTEKRVRIAAPLIAILFAGIFFFLLKTQSWVMVRGVKFVDTLSEFGDSVYGKLFKAAGIIGENHWFSGAGLKGFRVLCETMENQGLLTYCNLHPHNTYLEWFAETGVIGLLLYGSMVIALLVTSLRYFRAASGVGRLPAAVAFGTIFINLFPLMVTQSIFSNWPAILLWYSIGVAFAGLNLIPSLKNNFTDI